MKLEAKATIATAIFVNTEIAIGCIAYLYTKDMFSAFLTPLIVTYSLVVIFFTRSLLINHLRNNP